MILRYCDSHKGMKKRTNENNHFTEFNQAVEFKGGRFYPTFYDVLQSYSFSKTIFLLRTYMIIKNRTHFFLIPYLNINQYLYPKKCKKKKRSLWRGVGVKKKSSKKKVS